MMTYLLDSHLEKRFFTSSFLSFSKTHSLFLIEKAVRLSNHLRIQFTSYSTYLFC